MTDNNEIPADGGKPVQKIVTTTAHDCPKCGAPIDLLDDSRDDDLRLKCKDCGQGYYGHNENNALILDDPIEVEKPEEKPAPPKPKEKQVKSVEIVSIFGTDKISGVSSFEDLPDRVNVSGHIEESVEYEREGKLVKDIKNIPACVSVPRSAIISMNKTYHQ
jgi:predicted RNA-binding Zn-ribbon protein involved in translation (DUF1610 family)